MEIAEDDETIEVLMQPLVTEVHVTGNLTGQGVKASVKAGSARSMTRDNGTARLRALCTDRVRIKAKGYEPFTIETLEGPRQEQPIEVELEAGPAETAHQMVEWQSKGKFEKVWEWVHPDAKSYLTKKEYLSDARYYVRQGYSFVSIDVNAVNIIRWVYPACSLADFGPKAYPGAAALRVVYHEAQPQGGLRDLPALIHKVQTKDGLWRWFPTTGCDYEPQGG